MLKRESFLCSLLKKELFLFGNADRKHVTGWEKQRCQRNGPFSVYPPSTHTTRLAFQSPRLATSRHFLVNVLGLFWITYFVCRVCLPNFGFEWFYKRCETRHTGHRPGYRLLHLLTQTKQSMMPPELGKYNALKISNSCAGHLGFPC